MAIQDDFTIDYVDRKITYTTAFVDDRPPFIYTVNELYSYLQDVFDEPQQMDDPIPMSAQTPTQYTLLYPWFMDNESMKALYGGSIQTSGWTQSGSEGITATHWASATAAPDAADIGKAVTGSSGATGVILAVDTTRQMVWIRNTNATAFGDSDTIDDDATGTDPVYTTDASRGSQTGENIWINVFSVGTLQTGTEVYIGQEDDQMGGTAFHDADVDSRLERRIEKLDEWWDSDVDFATGSPNLLGGAGHIDLLILTQEMGNLIDGGRLFAGARQFSTIYSHFEFTAANAGNFVVPFSSTGSDLNSQQGPYTVGFDVNSGTIEVGDVVENGTGAGSNAPDGRLRLVITGGTTLDQPTGTIEYYLIGENEPLTTTDRTLQQIADNDNMEVRTSGVTFDIDGTPTQVTNGPAQADPGAGAVSITFGDTQVDVDEDGTVEQYACTIDCAGNTLASVYRRVQFLTSRGNQDGTTPDTQDTLLPSVTNPATPSSEAGEFYRAVGDFIFTWDADAGTGVTEGQLVKGSLSGATGVVVSATAVETSGTGTLVLTQVKGTFVNNDVVSDIDDGVTNTVTLAGAGTAIVDNTGAPFGSFAGGRWFVAQGVVLINVPAADANNWETVDLSGTIKAPPTTRSITFAGLQSGDRAAIFEVATAGDDDIVKTAVGVASGAVGGTSVVLDANVELDVPPSGWVRIVDTSDAANGTEWRMEYSSYSGATVTLRDISAFTATADGGGTTTTIVDTGAFTNFGADGEPKIGMLVRNTTDSLYSIVVRKIDNDTLEVTDNGTTWASKAYEFNTLPVLLDNADTCYFPYIDDVATAASISKTIKYVSDTEIVARARFSSPDIGGQRILPFEQLGQTITDADLTITAIQNADNIAS